MKICIRIIRVYCFNTVAGKFKFCLEGLLISVFSYLKMDESSIKPYCVLMEELQEKLTKSAEIG